VLLVSEILKTWAQLGKPNLVFRPCGWCHDAEYKHTRRTLRCCRKGVEKFHNREKGDVSQVRQRISTGNGQHLVFTNC